MRILSFWLLYTAVLFGQSIEVDSIDVKTTCKGYLALEFFQGDEGGPEVCVGNRGCGDTAICDSAVITGLTLDVNPTAPFLTLIGIPVIAGSFLIRGIYYLPGRLFQATADTTLGNNSGAKRKVKNEEFHPPNDSLYEIKQDSLLQNETASFRMLTKGVSSALWRVQLDKSGDLYSSEGFSLNIVGANYVRNEGFCLSGIYQYARSGNGFALSGIYNGASRFRGLQIALVNHTKRLKGVQIGLWNISQNRSLPLMNAEF
jgi:hypothetical protein